MFHIAEGVRGVVFAETLVQHHHTCTHEQQEEYNPGFLEHRWILLLQIPWASGCLP